VGASAGGCGPRTAVGCPMRRPLWWIGGSTADDGGAAAVASIARCRGLLRSGHRHFSCQTSRGISQCSSVICHLPSGNRRMGKDSASVRAPNFADKSPERLGWDLPRARPALAGPALALALTWCSGSGSGSAFLLPAGGVDLRRVRFAGRHRKRGRALSISHVACHVSRVPCHVSHATCHMCDAQQHRARGGVHSLARRPCQSQQSTINNPQSTINHPARWVTNRDSPSGPCPHLSSRPLWPSPDAQKIPCHRGVCRQYSRSARPPVRRASDLDRPHILPGKSPYGRWPMAHGPWGLSPGLNRLRSASLRALHSAVGSSEAAGVREEDDFFSLPSPHASPPREGHARNQQKLNIQHCLGTLNGT
jgi:hypothetical protein